MKKNLLLLLGLTAVLSLCAQSTEHRETIRQELRFEQAGADNLLIVRNISGDITVEGYDGATVQLEVVKTIRAKTEERINRGREEVNPGVVERSGTILCYLQTPCSENYAGVSEQTLREDRNWGWREDCHWEPDYDHQLDYHLKVPRNVQLRLATVNNGDIEVHDVSGRLQLNNVNGAITMEQVAGPAEARTINGDLTLRFERNPPANSSFYTLNGDIKAYFRPGLTADLYFKSFNGEFYTDIDEVVNLPPTLEKEEKENGQGIRFKVGGGPAVRVRNGGVRIDFETFNGDVYVREE